MSRASTSEVPICISAIISELKVFSPSTVAATVSRVEVLASFDVVLQDVYTTMPKGGMEVLAKLKMGLI